MLVMLREVLGTLRQVEALGPVLVVTPDAAVAALAEGCGAHVLRETGPSTHSAAATAGFAHARARGAALALTLPADAPLVTPGEVSQLLAAACPAPRRRVVLAPAHDRDGTNAILAAPPDAFPASFGPGSFARHLAAAATLGVDCRVVELAGLARDIDDPRDLEVLLAARRNDPGYAFLRCPGAGASAP